MLTEAKNTLRVILLSLKYNIMREMTNTVSFILNVVMMMFNNSTFIIQWLVMFSLKDSIGGFGFKEVMLMWGISSATFGISHLFFDGAYELDSIVTEGKLDAYLVQPKNTLLMVITSKTSISALGDLLYGIIVALIFWHELHHILLFFIYIILGSIIYTAFMLIIHGITFWFPTINDAADSINSLFVNFSLYPLDIFNEVIKIIMFTIIPAGIAVYLPIISIMNFNLYYLLIVLGAAIIFVLIAFITFYSGLKRYTSSNLMSSRI